MLSCNVVIMFLAVAVFTMIGCGRSEIEPANFPRSPSNVEHAPADARKADEESSHAREHTSRRPVVELRSIGLDEFNADSVQSDQQWNTEVASEVVSKKLNIIASRIKNPVGHDQDIQVASGFRTNNLSPNVMTVMEDASLIVRRADLPNSASANEPQDFVLSDLQAAISKVRQRLVDAEAIRAKFKTIKIELNEKSVVSESLLELTGRLSTGVYQQRATWKCEWTQSEVKGKRPQLTLNSISVLKYEECLSKAHGRDLMSDCTVAVLGHNDSFQKQLAYSTDYWLDRVEFRYGIDPGAWLGMSVGDANGDGLDDLYLCQPGGLPNRLYLQSEDGTATDASANAGVDWLDHTHSSLFVDLDNDGDQDLVLAVKPGLLIMANNGQGAFSVVATKFIPKANPYALSASDVDNDGNLDLYVSCYSHRRSDTDRNFLQRPVPYHDANNGGRNVLFKNRGNWRFQDVTNDLGLDANNRRFSFAASWEDYDNDGDSDLYVANDYGRNNLYRNQNRAFEDSANAAGVEDISAGMSVSWGDYNNDGHVDLYVSNMFSAAGNRIAYQRQFRTSDHAETRSDYQRHARGNSLFQNQGDGTFRDVSLDAGVTMGRWAWTSSFADLNNDGYDDLIVANGFITQPDEADL